MSKIQLEVGETYADAQGRHVKITEHRPGTAQPYVGVWVKGTAPTPAGEATWGADGRFLTWSSTSSCDLVRHIPEMWVLHHEDLIRAVIDKKVVQREDRGIWHDVHPKEPASALLFVLNNINENYRIKPEPGWQYAPVFRDAVGMPKLGYARFRRADVQPNQFGLQAEAVLHIKVDPATLAVIDHKTETL